MKKLITLSLLALTLSCNKEDESSDKETLITTSTLLGFWQPSQIIKADGTLQAYTHLCTTKDKLEFYQINSLKETLHDANCNPYVDYECQQYQILPNNMMINCNNKYDGKYTLLNSSTLKIEYEAVRNFPNSLQFISAKGLILVRQ